MMSLYLLARKYTAKASTKYESSDSRGCYAYLTVIYCYVTYYTVPVINNNDIMM